MRGRRKRLLGGSRFTTADPPDTGPRNRQNFWTAPARVSGRHTLAAAVSPDGRFAAVAFYQSNCIRLWDLATGALTARLFGHGAPVVGLRFVGATLVSGDREGELKTWNASSP